MQYEKWIATSDVYHVRNKVQVFYSFIKVNKFFTSAIECNYIFYYNSYQYIYFMPSSIGEGTDTYVSLYQHEPKLTFALVDNINIAQMLW